MGWNLWRHDAVMAVLGVFSIALIFWADHPTTTPETIRLLIWIDLALVVLFFIDWILCIREAKNGRAWAIRNSWRLLGMVPLALADLSFLRLLRLSRIAMILMRIPKVREAVNNLRRTLKAGDLGPLAAAAGFITLFGAILVWLAERAYNPNLEAFGEALWWAVVTVTTVGYGDITPITNLGRAVAVVLMVTGIGTIGLLASRVGSAIAQGADKHPDGESIPDRASAREPAMVDALERLAALHRDGHLDESEYQHAKRRLLD